MVAGYLGVDITPGFPAGRPAVPAAELFRPGRLIETAGLGISLGGVVANTGLAMKRFGQRVALMGTVGCDSLGDMVLSKLSAYEVAGGVRRNRRAGTAYGIVISPPGMDRIFFEDPGCNAVFTTRDIDFSTVARSRLFHFGYPPLMEKMLSSNGTELVRLFRRVRRLGVAVSLDMALPDSSGPGGNIDWQAILARVLPWVDIFVPSIEEILFMLEPDKYNRLLAAAAGKDMVDMVSQDLFDHLAGRILSLGVRVLMIKAGHRGAYVRTGDISKLNASTSLKLPVGNWSDRSLWAGPCPVSARRMKNACGAGDCAVAGFLSAVLKGVEIEKATRYAMLAGRDNLYGADAISGLRGWETMTRSIGHPARLPKK